MTPALLAQLQWYSIGPQLVGWGVCLILGGLAGAGLTALARKR